MKSKKYNPTPFLEKLANIKTSEECFQLFLNGAKEVHRVVEELQAAFPVNAPVDMRKKSHRELMKEVEKLYFSYSEVLLSFDDRVKPLYESLDYLYKESYVVAEKLADIYGDLEEIARAEENSKVPANMTGCIPAFAIL